MYNNKKKKNNTTTTNNNNNDSNNNNSLMRWSIAAITSMSYYNIYDHFYVIICDSIV